VSHAEGSELVSNAMAGAHKENVGCREQYDQDVIRGQLALQPRIQILRVFLRLQKTENEQL
jgi:hypothetical protein